MTSLQNNYNAACEAYIKKFCKKQDMEFMGWVGDLVGDIALCNDFFFSFRDIVWDVNSNQPEGLIIKWYDYCLENIEKSVNYYAFTKSVR